MVDKNDDKVYDAEVSRLIWIDCEMTGLDIFHDELCEVSVVPTDFNLNVLDDGIDIIIRPSQAAVDNMNDFVRHMHTSSGLVDMWEDHGVSVAQAQQKVLEYVEQFLPQGEKALLAGNTIGSDKKFLDHFMPELMSKLHYRTIDVSSLKELARRWYPQVYKNQPKKHEMHCALVDIIESIDELRYYRSMLFTPTPGPDAAQAQECAAQIEATSLYRKYESRGDVRARQSAQ